MGCGRWPSLSVMPRSLRFLTVAVATHSAAVLAVTDWPQFRGPDGNGIARDSKPPLEWSETNQVQWKTPIHGKGWASPVIEAGKIWIATATEDGHELSILKLDAGTGQIELDRRLFEIGRPQFCHQFNSYASPTPVAEPGRVYVTFGSPGTACLDAATGTTLWERRDFVCNHYRGAGSSPILYRDLLVMNFDGSDAQFVVALDKNSGRTVWRVNRSVDFKDLDPDGKPMGDGDFRKAFSTPHIATIDGVATLLSQGAKALYAYDPRTGTERWRVEERQNHSASTRPLCGEGLVFAATGFSTGQVLAIRPGQDGEVVDADSPPSPGAHLQLVWKVRRGAPKKPSMILDRGLLFGIEDGGVATCWDAHTGEVLWNERIGGDHSASPILADGRIYFFNEAGRATVIAADREFRKLAANMLDDGFMASPAVTGDALIVRTRSHLYRIEGD